MAKKKILILEDDAAFAGSLERTMAASLGAQVVKTSSASEAMRLIDSEQPDLLLTDIHLGDQNFLTLLNELASYPDTLHLPKIILSSSGRDLNANDLEKYGVSAVYDKRTYDLSDVIERARKCLRI